MKDYAAIYGLEFNPFIKNAREILVETGELSEVQVRLKTLEIVQEFGILTGEAGCGKTTGARVWANSLNQSRFKVIYTSFSTLTVMDFYRNLVALFGSVRVGRNPPPRVA